MINCYDHGLLDFKSAVQYMKYFIYHFTKVEGYTIIIELINNRSWVDA